jgi:hypothetical protein
MAHFLAGDDKFRGLIHDDDDRSHPMARSDSAAYRFGRTRAKHLRRGRAALGRVNGYLKNMIEAIANSKLRRMQRELELRGVRFDRSGNNWVTRDRARTEVRED